MLIFGFADRTIREHAVRGRAMPLWWAVAVAAALTVVACGLTPPEAPETPGQPNFLVIVADDLGFSDLGLMGSEIRTPNLDALAATGTVLTNFHVAPTCSPTRAMLLTGVDTHPAGLGTMSGEQSVEQIGQPGYEGVMSDRVVTVATLLREAGYQTYHVGKWHLGAEPGQQPTDRGFERSFGPARGGASHFSDQLRMFFDDEENSRALYLEDGKPVERLPEDFFSSESYTDKLIAQLEGGRGDGRPFFAYASYTAPHWPLQVPDEWLDRYAGTYDAGWDTLRARRVAALRDRGLIPDNTQSPDLVAWEDPWHTLTPVKQRHASRRMELYAAMVENLDHHIGRLLAYLTQSGQFDNTLIVFLSDNGAEGNLVNRIAADWNWVERRFDNRLENLGRRGSYVFTGPGWAQASTAPFGYYKAFPSEGGTRTPAIFSGVGVNGGITSQSFATVKDLTPTLLDLAGVPRPRGLFNGRAVASIEGSSLAPLLSGATNRVHNTDYEVGWELFGRRAMRVGDWKILWLYEPYGEGRWWLFDLASDPAETNDLSRDRPEKLAEMVAAWDRYAAANQVVLPASDAGYGREDPW